MRSLPFALLMCVVVAACKPKAPPTIYQAPPGDSSSLESLVAPIALYPDPLVAQILPASTNPMEVVAAADALAQGGRPSEATASQWDASIQALLSFPTVLKMMSDRIQWTTQLGQAFTANEGGVLAAIQQVRRKAQAAGNLQSNAQQVITTQGSTVIIEPANPAYIYVPQYNPVAILAPAPYAYYPMMTFGVGFAAGAATAYACSWGAYGGSSVVVNNNYHYSYNNSYSSYHAYNSNTGSYGSYHPQSGTYTGYDAKTGTYGAYNPSTGKYGTYDPSTGQYNKNGQTGTWHPPSNTETSHGYGSTSDTYHGYGSSSAWGDHSSWGSGSGSGGDAFHGVGGGGWGAQDASARGSDSLGGQRYGGGGWGGRGGGFGGGGWGGGRGFGGGGFGGFRGGGFGGRR